MGMGLFQKLLHLAELTENNCPVPRVPPRLLQAQREPCFSFGALRDQHHHVTLTPFTSVELKGDTRFWGVTASFHQVLPVFPSSAPCTPQRQKNPRAPGSQCCRRQEQHIRIHHTTLTQRLAGYCLTMHSALMHKFEAM